MPSHYDIDADVTIYGPSQYGLFSTSMVVVGGAVPMLIVGAPVSSSMADGYGDVDGDAHHMYADMTPLLMLIPLRMYDMLVSIGRTCRWLHRHSRTYLCVCIQRHDHPQDHHHNVVEHHWYVTCDM